MPRKATQTPIVKTTDQAVETSWWRWNLKKTTGAVRISTIVAMFRGTVDPREMGGLIASTPAFFVSFKDHPVLYSFLSSLDLFTIWTLVLLTIGFAYVARVSKTRSAVTVVSWWAFLVLVKVGFAAMGAARMKANG